MSIKITPDSTRYNAAQRTSLQYYLKLGAITSLALTALACIGEIEPPPAKSDDSGSSSNHFKNMPPGMSGYMGE